MGGELRVEIFLQLAELIVSLTDREWIANKPLRRRRSAT
jgi:hypothetical protein